MDGFTDRFIAEATEYEFKSAVEVKKAKSWLKTVSAFSNGLGGTIYFGVNKDGTFQGVENLQELSEKISELILAKIEPAVFFLLAPVQKDEKNDLKVRSEAGNDAPLLLCF